MLLGVYAQYWIKTSKGQVFRGFLGESLVSEQICTKQHLYPGIDSRLLPDDMCLLKVCHTPHRPRIEPLVAVGRTLTEVGNVVTDPCRDCGLKCFVETVFVGQHRDVVEERQVDLGRDQCVAVMYDFADYRHGFGVVFQQWDCDAAFFQRARCLP